MGYDGCVSASFFEGWRGGGGLEVGREGEFPLCNDSREHLVGQLTYIFNLAYKNSSLNFWVIFPTLTTPPIVYTQ